MTLVWLPADARREALGDLPEEVVLGVLPEDGAAPQEAGEVDVLVLAPTGRDAAGGAPAVDAPPAPGPDAQRRSRLGAAAAARRAAVLGDRRARRGRWPEWVVAVVLAMGKRLPHLVEQHRLGCWDASANLAFGEGPAADDLACATVLVVGHGSIGRAVQARLEPFGTEVVGVASRARDGVAGPEDLPGLLPSADVVVLLAPATPATAGLVDAAFLDAMRPGALLVNASRGALVDTDALLTRLHAGRLRAVLDSTDPEPLPQGHPLWSAPGVLVTPHVAGSSAFWQDRAYRLVGDQLRRLVAGAPLRNDRTPAAVGRHP